MYKIYVSSDAYAVQNSNEFHSKKIFVNPEAADNDLSKLPYLKKIKTGLSRKGYTLVESENESDLILFFDVFLGDPIVIKEQSLKKTKPITSTGTKTRADGTSETIEITTPGQKIPYYSESVSIEKVLMFELKDRRSKKLIWQSKTVIDSEEKSYAPYTNWLVFTGIRNFLQDTPQHPHNSSIGLKERSQIDFLLSEND